jgi:hypothetical protein
MSVRFAAAEGDAMSDADASEAAPNHETIKRMALELGQRATSLYALAPGNDPFYINPSRRVAARWFGALFEQLAPPRGVHLRRLHYQLISLRTPPIKPDGQSYANTYNDWVLMCSAARDARYMRICEAGHFSDHGTTEPFVHQPMDMNAPASLTATDEIERPNPEETPAVYDYAPQQYEFPDELPPVLSVAPPTVSEPYAIEIWIEKSTLDDILVPLCHRHGATLVTGVGEMSLTQCNDLIERTQRHGRRERILYLSDFDPSGANMPISVARKIEFINRRDQLNLDIQLNPLALTVEQCRHYRLPRTPIKDSERSKAQFENRFGAGATELDALEALHPGELAKIVERTIRGYRQPARQARQRNSRIADDLNAVLLDHRQSVIAEHTAEIEQLRVDFEAMCDRIAPHQDALAEAADEIERRCASHVDAINVEVDAFYEAANALQERIADVLRGRAPDLETVTWAEVADASADSNDPLFDSRRDYLDQIERYKRHQGRR